MEILGKEYIDKFAELEKKAEIFYPTIKIPSYIIKIESRDTYTIGCFTWMYGGYSYEIFLNAAYIVTNTKEEIDNVIVHEFCHFLNQVINGNDVKPHGKEWKKIMREFGGVEKPRALNSTVKSRAKTVYACGCTFYSAKPKTKEACCIKCNQQITIF